jgi:hypothetical protein
MFDSARVFRFGVRARFGAGEPGTSNVEAGTEPEPELRREN